MKSDRDWRYSLLGIGFILVVLAIFIQTIRIQMSPQSEIFKDLAKNVYAGREEEVYPPRGLIYDRWGNLLAGYKPVYEIGVDLQYVNEDTGARDISMALSMVLGLEYGDIFEIVSTPYSPTAAYLPIVRSVPPELVDQIQSSSRSKSIKIH